ncbi:MAG: hypothetical protein GWN00_19875 [Aliifodinibius sp.]|nr:hypothetical protein [Fodinibius sp.]NIY26980.1 hypothetical protein [Fodinibius sp.]
MKKLNEIPSSADRAKIISFFASHGVNIPLNVINASVTMGELSTSIRGILKKNSGNGSSGGQS